MFVYEVDKFSFHSSHRRSSWASLRVICLISLKEMCDYIGKLNIFGGGTDKKRKRKKGVGSIT